MNNQSTTILKFLILYHKTTSNIWAAHSVESVVAIKSHINLSDSIHILTAIYFEMDISMLSKQ